jgi:outer membrane beta-barrel protein
LGAGANWYFNQLSDSARELIQTRNLYPVMSYIRRTVEGNASFRTFYGKIRFTLANVIHFDQYLSLGGAKLALNDNVSRDALTWDAGFNFWLGRSMSAKLGLKDYVYKDSPAFKSAWTQDLQAHLDLGYVL